MEVVKPEMDRVEGNDPKPSKENLINNAKIMGEFEYKKTLHSLDLIY